MGLFLGKLICNPCSNRDQAAYSVKAKAHAIKTHVDSERHKKALEKFGIRPYNGCQGQKTFSDMLARMKLAEMDGRTRQFALLLFLLKQKRPISEYVCYFTVQVLGSPLTEMFVVMQLSGVVCFV